MLILFCVFIRFVFFPSRSSCNYNLFLQDYPDTAKLLAAENVDKDALQTYAREAANFSTENMLPQLDFAVNHYGQPDVAMFDFTSMFAAENASRVIERHGHKLLQILVGDSLLEVSQECKCGDAHDRVTPDSYSFFQQEHGN